jgi:hypothetical protein
LWVKEARLQSEAQEGEAVLTSYVLKLLGQLSVLFLQGEELLQTFDRSLTTG